VININNAFSFISSKASNINININFIFRKESTKLSLLSAIRSELIQHSLNIDNTYPFSPEKIKFPRIEWDKCSTKIRITAKNQSLFDDLSNYYSSLESIVNFIQNRPKTEGIRSCIEPLEIEQALQIRAHIAFSTVNELMESHDDYWRVTYFKKYLEIMHPKIYKLQY